MKTLVWTDGSCNAEGVAGRGGWAALIERDGSTEQLVGSAMETTQNRMELTAVCEALERVAGAIEVRTDSTYIEKCFSEGWHIWWRQDDKWRTTKGPVKNRDLWERLFALVEDDARDVSFVWLKRATEANNSIVDRLSREASKSHDGGRVAAVTLPLIDHLALRVRDERRSRSFYEQALEPLGVKVVESSRGPGFAIEGGGDFWIEEGEPPAAPIHVAFAAADRATVDRFHRVAVEAGGRDNGAPGLRPQYHAGYYAAFVIDPDGNNVEAVFHGDRELPAT